MAASPDVDSTVPVVTGTPMLPATVGNIGVLDGERSSAAEPFPRGIEAAKTGTPPGHDPHGTESPERLGEARHIPGGSLPARAWERTGAEGSTPMPADGMDDTPDQPRSATLPPFPSAAERLWLATQNALPPDPAHLAPPVPSTTRGALDSLLSLIPLKVANREDPLADATSAVGSPSRPEASTSVVATATVLRPPIPAPGIAVSAPIPAGLALPVEALSAWHKWEEDGIPGLMSSAGMTATPPGIILPAGPNAANPSVPMATVARLAEAAGALVSARGDGGTEVALSPAELGKVRLHLQGDPADLDRLVVVMTFDRAETLDLFRRHAADLQSALREAGYGEAQLSFGHSGTGDGAAARHDRPAHGLDTARQGEPAPARAPQEEIANLSGPRPAGSLDIRV